MVLFLLKVSAGSEVTSGNATVTGLFANTGYSFRVRGQNKYGIGNPSKESCKYKVELS